MRLVTFTQLSKIKVIDLIEADKTALEAKDELSEDEEDELLFAKQWLAFGADANT